MLTPPSIPEYTVNDRSSYTFSSLGSISPPKKLFANFFLWHKYVWGMGLGTKTIKNDGFDT